MTINIRTFNQYYEKHQCSCSGTGGRTATDNEAGEQLRVAGPLRPALSDALDADDAADLVGDCVVALVLLRRMLVSVGEFASLLEVEVIGRAGDGGTALISKTYAFFAA